jgi:hypothetical protein
MKKITFIERKNGKTVARGTYDESLRQLIVETIADGYRNILMTLSLEVESTLGEKYEIKQDDLGLVLADISTIGVMRLKQIMLSRYPEIRIEEADLI